MSILFFWGLIIMSIFQSIIIFIITYVVAFLMAVFIRWAFLNEFGNSKPEDEYVLTQSLINTHKNLQFYGIVFLIAKFLIGINFISKICIIAMIIIVVLYVIGFLIQAVPILLSIVVNFKNPVNKYNLLYLITDTLSILPFILVLCDLIL